jgi:1-acyl-sn-glycerol-3-phosphate acyltransferase
MPPSKNIPPKPHTRYHNPELTRLPNHSLAQRIFRWLVHFVVLVLDKLLLSTQLVGMENFPRQGPAFVVMNHLGDAEAVLVAAHLPLSVDAFTAIDLYYEHTFLGRIMDAYGVIWIHRGTPDRHALRMGLQGIAEGRIIVIAPEGRESVTGSLEEGTSGAAFLALRTGVPLIPVTFTGTSNKVIYPNLHRLRRSPVSMTVGPPFNLQVTGTGKDALESATLEIMRALACQLPEELRGVYKSSTSQGL